MASPSLTIIIPEHDRPAMLRRALDSALDQTVAARILVSDDSTDPDATAAMLREHFADRVKSGQVRHIVNPPRGAWQNWKAGALAAETDLVAWLQDDDIVSPRYVERITRAFAEAEQLGARPSVWMARLDSADASGRYGLHYSFNGPYVPMRTLHGVCEPIHYRQGACIAASAPFTSWSLSPALAYRNGDRFRDVLESIPDGCDVFIERLVPAAMALDGGFIADPAVVGYWVQHGVVGAHLSHHQWADQPRQTKLLVRYLDDLLDRTPGWEPQFAAWCGVVPPMLLLGWLGQLDTTEREGGRSRHGATLRRLMWESCAGRVRTIRPPWHVRARALWDRVLKSLSP